MTIDLVRPLDLTQDDIAAWTRLQGEGPLASPFLSPHWARAVARVKGPDAERARVAIVREGGEAKGFMAARVGRVTAMPVGAPMCDYQGLVAANDLAVEPRRLVTAMGVQRMDFTSLMIEAPAFAGCARGRAVSHVLDISKGYDAYAADRLAAGTDILKDCAKKRRKLERELGEVTFTAESRSLHDFDALIAWKRAQYAQTGQTDIPVARLDAGPPARPVRARRAGVARGDVHPARAPASWRRCTMRCARPGSPTPGSSPTTTPCSAIRRA